METTTKIELIDVKEDSDLLLKTLMEARVLLSRIETYRNWIFWATIGFFAMQVLRVILIYALQISDWYWEVLVAIPITCAITLNFSLNKLLRKFNGVYQRCTSMASKIAQNIEKNQYLEKGYSIPKYALSAIDLYENDKGKAYIIISSLKNTISITMTISAMSLITYYSYGSLLSHQETQNKQLKTQIDSLNRVNQELIKKELKNK
jgi:hypothetical protein